MRIYPQRSAAAAAAFLNRERTSRVWQRCELPCYLPRSPERSRRTRCRRRVRQGRSAAAAALLNREVVVPALILLFIQHFSTVLYRIHNHQSVSQPIISLSRPALTPPPAPPLPFDHKYQTVSQLLTTQVGEWSTIFHFYKAPTLQYTCLGIEWLFHGPARAHPSAGSPFTTSGPPSTGQSARGPLSHGRRHGRRHAWPTGRHNQELHPAGYNTSDQAAQARIGRGGDEPDYQDVDRTHLNAIRIPRDRPLHTESPWITEVPGTVTATNMNRRPFVAQVRLRALHVHRRYPYSS